MQLTPILMEYFFKPFGFVLLYLFIFMLSRWFKDVFIKYHINEKLIKQDNFAVSLTMSGYYLGVLAIFVGAFNGPSYGFVKDISLIVSYSILGLFFLNISRFLNNKIILRNNLCNSAALEDKNIAVACVEFGTYVATGLIVAGSITGTGGGLLTAIVFFVLGQLSLFLFSFLYDWITPYCIHDEIKNKNIAAGIAFGGNLIALSIIILNGVSQNFVTWEASLLQLLIMNLLGFLFLPLLRIVTNKIMIVGDDLNREIAEDQNKAAGLLEAIMAISFAVLMNVIL